MAVNPRMKIKLAGYGVMIALVLGLAAHSPSAGLPKRAMFGTPGAEIHSPVRTRAAVKIPFEFVEGLIVCALPTSRGKLRFVFDTGANATVLLGKPGPVEIRIGGKSLKIVSAPLRTSALEQLNSSLPPTDRIKGILGQDVLVQFQRVTVDYKSLDVEFDP